jgi:hypothetical protein
MPKKLTQEEFITKAKLIHGDKYDYSLVEYQGVMKKVKIIYEGIIYEQIANDHLHGHRPEISHYTNNTEHFIQKAKKIHDNKYNYSKVDYINQNKKVIIIYEGKEYKQTPRQHIQGYKPELINRLSLDEFIERCKKIHNNKYDYSLVEYVNVLCKIKIIYKGITYEQTANDHLSGYTPLEIQPKSKGEEKIKIFLQNRKINHVEQHTYEGCRNKYKLPFDFYLPDFNILIEYDGIQHFRSIDYFGGEESYKYRKMCDEIKNEYTQKNKIPLLRISYFDFENIENILSEFIRSYSTSSFYNPYLSDIDKINQ